MKTIAVCVAILAIASAQFTFDAPTFIDAGLQGVLGWAYPQNFQTCRDNYETMLHAYVAFWETFDNFNYSTLQSSGQSFLGMYMASPRCYYGTNIVEVVTSEFSFAVLEAIFGVFDLGLLAWFLSEAYDIIVYYGSMVFDVWALYYDAMSVYQGTYDSATLGYIAAFFVRSIFHTSI